MSEKMFEKASRTKLRFTTAKGILSTEDLWDIPLYSENQGAVTLDSLACQLHARLSLDVVPSFVKKATDNATASLQLQFDIVKHILDCRMADIEARKVAAGVKQRKQDLLALIREKEKEQLAGTSLDDLRKLVDALDDGE